MDELEVEWDMNSTVLVKLRKKAISLRMSKQVKVDS